MMPVHDNNNNNDDEAELELAWGKNALHWWLWTEHEIEVPVFVYRRELYLRVSCPLYIGEAQVRRLADAVTALMEGGSGERGGEGRTSKAKARARVIMAKPGVSRL